MKPRVQALLLADRVYRDQTGKHIIGGFSFLLVLKFADFAKKMPEPAGEYIAKGVWTPLNAQGGLLCNDVLLSHVQVVVLL